MIVEEAKRNFDLVRRPSPSWIDLQHDLATRVAAFAEDLGALGLDERRRCLDVGFLLSGFDEPGDFGELCGMRPNEACVLPPKG